ncbi:MAG: MFS transporter [Armatimonadota bacterium]
MLSALDRIRSTLLDTFPAMRSRDYRLYWIGAMTSFTGGWVQATTYSYLVYEITGSKQWLGLVNAVGAIPLFVLTLFAGAVADRVNKKKALVLTQSLSACFAVALGILVGSGHITKYHILVIAFLQGIVMAFDSPIRQSMPVHLVPKKYLTNAIVLNSAAFNTARVIGPAMGGYIAAKMGIPICFFINAASFFAVIAALMVVKARTPPGADLEVSLMDNLMAGLQYVWKKRVIRKIMIALTIYTMFTFPYMMLIPVFSKDILKVGIQGNGSLLMSVGMGALVAAVVLSTLSRISKLGRLLTVAATLGAVLLIVFANSNSFLLSRLMLIGVGFSAISFSQTCNSLIQNLADDALRGRVMGVYTFIFMGLSPFANYLTGYLAQKFGAQLTVTIFGVMFLINGAFLATQRDVLKH